MIAMTGLRHYRSSSEPSQSAAPLNVDATLDWQLSAAHRQAREDVENSISLAADNIQNGSLDSAERILLSCQSDCLALGPHFNLHRLLITIRLGDLYFRDEAWANAVQQYQAAYQIWDEDEHIADHERRLHPAHFLHKVAKCYEEAGSTLAPKMRVKAEQFVALYGQHDDDEHER